MKKLRIALAQINPTVGDLTGNVRKIKSYITKARRVSSDIVVFPELAVTGYPPEDLLLKHQFVQDNIDAMHEIRDAAENIVVITGFVDRDHGIYNAAAVISDRTLIDVYRKRHLPNYGVFDEYRYFRAGKRFPVYQLEGVNFGVNICEDIWRENGPSKIQALSGANIIININASPYHMGKMSIREELLSARARECGAMIFYVNTVGGQDELVFDGGSLIVNEKGLITGMGRQFREELIITDIEVSGKSYMPSRKDKAELKRLLPKGEFVEKKAIPFRSVKGKKPVLKQKNTRKVHDTGEIYEALILGTKDYVRKNGFEHVVIGMSGGIDSALVATIAVDALGKEKVHGLFMPSRYTSRESYEDAFAHAKNLGIKILSIPIDSVFKEYLRIFSSPFRGMRPDITEENLQARIRGNILMAFSNKFGWLVLTTGNKSEMSVGYATLYGDMAGGFAVIKDVPKTLVYELCLWRNRKEGRGLIPDRILMKEPTAELKPDQRDTDTLPPYPALDSILKAYVEEDRSFIEIVAAGNDLERVRKVIRMVDHAEYKRRQAPPGIKITPRAFGKDRRFPITNRYKSY
ncbi:MAG: NAD+ synthase [Nitrospiraceae bacterium]|nr:MAG: NAD+ synthase [Nitrospiraceae bacterium]